MSQRYGELPEDHYYRAGPGDHEETIDLAPGVSLWIYKYAPLPDDDEPPAWAADLYRQGYGMVRSGEPHWTRMGAITSVLESVRTRYPREFGWL